MKAKSPKTGDIRQRVCVQCDQGFSYEVSQGSDRSICSDFCRTQRRHAKAKAQPMCVVEGCQNLRSGHKSGICDSCYSRLRRTGTIEKRAWKYRSTTSHGYIVVHDKTHGLSRSNGCVYEHRKVLFDAIGPGPHECHWCHIPVDWIKGRCLRGSLVPDHLDGNKTNNALSNLVPACNRCNATRGLFMAWVRKHQEDPWLWQMFKDSIRLDGVA